MRKLSLVCTVLIAATPATAATFPAPPWLGRGGAGVGLADDAYAASYNPAGLAFVEWHEAHFPLYTLYLAGVHEETAMCGALRLPVGTLAAGLQHAWYSLPTEGGSFDGTDSRGYLAYGFRFARGFAFGIRISGFYSELDDLGHTTTAWSIGTLAGVLWRGRVLSRHSRDIGSGSRSRIRTAGSVSGASTTPCTRASGPR